MSNTTKFPKNKQVSPMPTTTIPGTPATSDFQHQEKKTFFTRVMQFLWIITVLIWPVLKWLISIEVFFQFIRMIYYWNTPNMHAGWIFLLHFTVLTALTYFVSIYKPKGL